MYFIIISTKIQSDKNSLDDDGDDDNIFIFFKS